MSRREFTEKTLALSAKQVLFVMHLNQTQSQFDKLKLHLNQIHYRI